jgi:hypothetical protein
VERPPTWIPTPEAVRRRAHRLLPVVLASVRSAETLSEPVADHDFGRTREFYSFTDEQQRRLTVRLDAVPLPRGQQVRVFANTTSENHVIQLSDQLPQEDVGTALAQGVTRLMAVRRRADVGVAPVRRDLLEATVVAVEGDPRRAVFSERDLGQLGELDWQVGRMIDPSSDEAGRQAARASFSAALDELGLRVTTEDRDGPAYKAQERARVFRLLAAEPMLGSAALRGIAELGKPIEQLPQQDAETLRINRVISADVPAVSDPQERATAEVVALTASIEPGDLTGAALRAAERRDRQSARTLTALRLEAEALPSGRLPKMAVMIGGGAALAGRDPNALLIDGRGRWHIDPIPSIVQSADQVQHLYESGLGDPHQFAGPRERVPLTAIQLWEDTAAARGPLIDGIARFDVDESGRLVADIEPIDGSDPIRLEVDGSPVVATGIPPEIVPGASRVVPTVPEALIALDEYLSVIDTRESLRARQTIAGMSDAPGTAARVLADLAEVPEIEQLRFAVRAGGIVGTSLTGAMTTLEATAAWDQAREDAPGRILAGDEVGDGNYDPQAGRRWMLAGIGGAAIANAEIILAANPDAEVVMVGTEAPWVLQNDAQYTALRQQHDKAVNPDATGRLITVTDRRLGQVATRRSDDGRTVVRMLGDRGEPLHTVRGDPLEGDVYVGCLGRVSRLPKALDNLKEWAEEIRGDLDLSADRQYLGYRLTFRNGPAAIDVEVTGAASRILPADVFDGRATARVNELGLVETPPESGNVAAGFMASALQGKRRADARTAARSRPPEAAELSELRRLGGLTGAAPTTGKTPPELKAATATQPPEETVRRQPRKPPTPRELS